ncbi:MAG: LLM class flavin-dependent oxidoreductase [Candidatus Binatia bacterium]
MGRITVGYQDGCLYPLWVSNLGMRMATLMGATSLWVPDHFMGFAPRWMWTPETIPGAKVVPSLDALFDPIQILAVAALKHRGVLLGTSVTEAIRRHPMSLAQSFVTLDHVSGGRAVLGLGNGVRENTEPYGLPVDRRVSRLEEALRIIRLLWDSGGRPVSFEGEFWQFEDAVFDLPLYRGRPPRIFMGAHFPRMLRLTGRYCDGWLPGQKVCGQEYASRLALISEAASEAGRSMEGFVASQTLMVVFDRSRDRVMELALKNPFCAYMALGMPPEVWTELGLEHPLGPHQQGFLDLVPSRVTREQVDTSLHRVTPELLDRVFFFGNADEICREVAPLAEAGCRHFIIANMGGSFTGNGIRDFWQQARLMHKLRSL